MKIIDLTHVMKEGMPVYPGTPAPLFTTDYTIEKNGFTETHLDMYSHTGTHMDFPYHMIEGAKTSSDFPTDKFFGSGVVIDCKHLEANSEVELTFLKKFSSGIDKSDFVLFNFGWDRYWGNPEYFENYPVLSEEAVEYLAGKNIKALGFDAISIDAADSGDFKNHMTVLKNDILVIENLTNLSELINKDFKLAVFPLKLEKKDGSPIRAAAIMD